MSATELTDSFSLVRKWQHVTDRQLKVSIGGGMGWGWGFEPKLIASRSVGGVGDLNRS